MKIGVLTISDRASAGLYEDLSGPAIRNWLDKALTSDYELVSEIVPEVSRAYPPHWWIWRTSESAVLS